MMKFINRLLDWLDIAGRLFERLLYLAAAIAGCVLGWVVMGALEYGVIVQCADHQLITSVESIFSYCKPYHPYHS